MQDRQDGHTGFLDELKRRRVVRVALGYAGAAFVLLQGLQILSDAFPDVVGAELFGGAVLFTLAGFPVALVLGWLFDLTPQGLRLTAQGGAGRVVIPARPGLLVGSVMVVVLGVVAFVGVARFPEPASADMAEANLMAVLPFTATGDGVEELGEGMVDLLTRNLDEVGAIHMVDPRTILYRWEEQARGKSLPFDQMLRVARESNASSMLTGSIVEAGGTVRFDATVFSVDGRRLASAQVTGASGNLLALVDSLSVKLVQEILRTDQPLPRLNVSAITSGNLEAIRAFLQGERYYRTSAWDSALASFSRAVEADSLFPLAHYRLASTAGWLGNAELARRSAAVARRYSDRLPAREQALLRAEELRSSGRRAAAVDSLSLYVERFPDDPEGWFLLADDLFHLRGEGAGPAGDGTSGPLAMFDRALELDPSYVPAMVHPLEIAFRRGDLQLAERYLQMLERAVPGSTATRVLRAAAAALGEPPSTAMMADALTRAVTTATGPLNLARQAGQAVYAPLVRDLATWPAAQRRAVMERLPRETLARSPELRLAVAIATGQLRGAHQLLADPQARRGIGKDRLQHLAVVPAFAGYAPAGWPGAVEGVPDPSPLQAAGLELVAAIDRGDARALAAVVQRTRALSGADAQVQEAVVRAGQGFQRVLRGDTVRGLLDAQTALEAVPFQAAAVTEALWFRWIERMAEHPGTRPRVLGTLAEPWPGAAVYNPLRLLVLGRALEAEGRIGEARDAYARVLNALAEADPDLPIHRRLAAARTAGARLGGSAR